MEFKLKRFKKEIEVTRIANIHYFEFTKEYHTFKDRHAFRELVYVDSGVITVDAENYKGSLTKNQMIIHKANETHSLSCALDTAPGVIIIGFACECAALDMFAALPCLLSAEQQKLLTGIIKEGRSVFLPPYDVPNLKDMKKRKEYPFGADQMIKLKMEELFIDLIRNHDTPKGASDADVLDSKIAEVTAYIDANYAENITLGELCFLFGTNKTTLCSRFRQFSGETLIGYLNRQRIKAAKKLMREGNYNLTQIAEIVGFSSIHYFSRIFKKYENQSPSTYIRTIKSRLML